MQRKYLKNWMTKKKKRKEKQRAEEADDDKMFDSCSVHSLVFCIC